MKTKSTLRSFLILAGSSLLAVSSAHAASGTWDTDADGDWTTVTNWSGDAAFASGTGFTATLGDFITADHIINLDTPITIGNITASDTSHNYTISGANTLTLDVSSGTPNINVTSSGRNLTISSVVAGADGISKTGLGTLTLSGSNTITGATSISGGGTFVLDYTNDNRKLPNNSTLTLAAGTIILKGGSATENFTSTTANTANGTFFVRDGGSSKINFNAFNPGSQTVVSFSDENMATTDRLHDTTGFLGGYFTVGDSWAANSTNAADGNIVKYTGATTFNPANATTNATNYNLTGDVTLTAARAVNTLRIVSDGVSDQTLNVGNFNLTTNSLSTSVQSPTPGGLLYAGGGTGNYTITSGVSGTGRLNIPNGNGQTQNINVYTGTLTLDVILQPGGSSSFQKTGAGTLVFNRTNAYSSATRVYQGVLRLTGAGNLTAGSTVQNGAAIELGNSVAIASTATLNITGTGVSNGGALRSVATTTSSYAGAITLGTGGARINSDSTGTLTLTGGVVTASGNNVTFGGAGNTTVSTAAISGSGGLIKDGAGTLTLSATNSFTGTATVNAGTLSVGNGTNSTALPDFGGLAVVSPAVVDLNYSGSDAVLTLDLGGSPMAAGQYGHTNSGADNGGAGVGFYDAFFAPNTGIINNLDGDTSLIGVLFWDGGVADIGTDGNAISAGGTGTWNTTTLNWDSGLGAHVAWNNSGNDTAVLGGADGTVTLGEPITAGGITSSSTSTISGASALTLDVISGSPIVDVTANTLTISSDIAGNDGLQKTGAGTLLLTGNKSFSGGLTMSAGTLQVNDASGVFGNGTLTVVGGQIRANANGQTSTTTNNHVWNGNFQLSRGTTGSATWNFQGDVTLGANVTVTHADNTVTTNLSGDISDGGNNRVLTLAGGSGFFILSGNNTHGGGTTLSAGTLRINSATAIGNGTFTISGATTIDNTSGNPITLSTNNVQAWNENFTFTGTNALNLGTGAVTMNNNRTVTVSAGTLTVGGNIGQSGGNRTLTKAGNGTLVLGGANNYAGTTTVSAGTLSVTGSLGASAVSVNAGTLSGNGNFGANVTIASGATHSIAVAATNGAQDTSAITGTLAMAGSILNLTAASTPAAGEYVLATATVGITGTPTTINYNGITGTVSVDTASTPKRLLLTVTGGSPFESWAGAGIAFDADANNDGVDNGLAWLLGASDKNANAIPLLPTMDNTTDPDFFIFTYRRDDDANTDPNTTIKVEYGSTLAAWAEATPSADIVITPTDDFYAAGIDKVEVKIRRTLAVGGKLFARLNVQNTP